MQQCYVWRYEMVQRVIKPSGLHEITLHQSELCDYINPDRVEHVCAAVEKGQKIFFSEKYSDFVAITPASENRYKLLTGVKGGLHALFYDFLFNQADVALLLIDSSGLIIRASAAFLELIDSENNSLVSVDYRVFFKEYFVETDKLLPDLNTDTKYRRKKFTGRDGDEYFVDFSIQNALFGEYRFSLLVFSDIAHHVELEERLLAMMKTHRKMSKSKSNFLASISHELKTPLSAITGMTDILRRQISDHDSSEKLDVIENSAYHLLDTIDEILGFTALEKGKIKVIPEHTNLLSLFEQTIKIFEMKSRLREIEIYLEVWPNLPVTGIIDNTKIRRVIANLINNAIRYTEPGGRIVVQVGLDREDKLFVEIADTGIGIEEKDYERIFHPFEQVENDYNRRFEGVGLGLTISRQLIESMNGEIILKSRTGVGSVFKFRVPLERPGARLIDLPPKKVFKGRRIEVYTDNDLLQSQVSLWLTYWEADFTLRDTGNLENVSDDVDFVFIDMPSQEDSLIWLEAARETLSKIPRVVILGREAARSEQSNVRFIEKPLWLHKFCKAFHDDSRPLCHECALAENCAEDKSVEKEQVVFSGSENILIVDDNHINLKVLATMLERFGFRPKQVDNGAGAVEYTAENRVDLVFMDLHMPGMDGIETTAKIRMQADIRQPRIIALTADSSEGIEDKLLSAGFDEYFPKPVKTERLIECLERNIYSAVL